jgi:DNA-binding SARP family transcriptional activator
MAKAQVLDNGAVQGELEWAAFQHFPYGMLIVDRDGLIVSSNLQARRLIEACELDAERASCCDLLGCRSEGTVLADACVTELAIAHGAPLPEIRIDVSCADGTVQALWAVTAPLAGDCAHFVIQLRPGPARDRRRRTEPHWMSGPSLRIRALGRTVVESAEGPLEGNWLDQRTGQLLKYLVTERKRFVHADEIGESLWSKADFAIASSVRYNIHALRRKIEPQRGHREPSAFILSRSGSYRLNLALVEVDADEFEASVGAGLAPGAGAEEAIASLEGGLALYGGDFLADLPYTDWTMAERHRLHHLACTALHRLTELRLQQGQSAEAGAALERLAKMSPYDEAVHRQLMELDIAAGRRSDAMRRYTALRARIRRTFGHDLDFTPADLSARRG